VNVLGISAFYHDSAAALVRDGEIVAAAQEERFSRVKHDAGFPSKAVRWCLSRLEGAPLDAVAFYEKPLTKFTRILETFFSVAPRGLPQFLRAIPLWTKEKLWMSALIEEGLARAGCSMPADLFFPEHHEAHAASAFFPSPFGSAAILTVDGVGEWATAAIGRGEGNRLDLAVEMRFPHSVGLLYSAFTTYCGFEVNSGEYKLMGLAPYGEPRYKALILDKLVDLKEDGSFRMNMDYFDYAHGLRMTGRRFHKLFGGPPRPRGFRQGPREADLARSVQEVTEEVILRMARHARKVTGESRLCMAGGVALNSVANGRLLREGVFDEVWIQPASGDAGGALGAALFACHQVLGGARKADGKRDRMNGAYLGPEYGEAEIREALEKRGTKARRLADGDRAATAARLLAGGAIVGLFDGRMEFGPRALGNRSIIADPRPAGMKDRLNRAVKHREPFRPFAPSVRAADAGKYFSLDRPSPYMLLVSPVRPERCVAPPDESGMDFDARAVLARSDIPAVTHVDCSARVHTVDRETNPAFHDLLSAFEAETGCGVLLNTSFNDKDEPIVMTPGDALDCFDRTGLDFLVLGPYLVGREGGA
jgi:carbamoyltransferase